MEELKKELKINKYLAIIFILNIIQSTFQGLAYDESYYWIYTNSLAFGHFDHPPMVGWLIKLGTTMWGHNELGVRFFFNILQLLMLKVLWKMSDRQSPNLFIMTSLMLPAVSLAGILALPDTPLMFFAVLFLYYVKQYLEKDCWKISLKIAISIALLFYSKYHGILLVLLTVVAYPKFLYRKSFWAIVLATTSLFLPHMLWQYQHEFVTFDYHLFKRKQHHFKMSNIFNYIGGQVGLAGILAAPVVFYALFKGNADRFTRILKVNIWGLFSFLLFSSLRNKIEANWTVTNFALLVPIISSMEFSEKIKKYYYLSSAVMIVALFTFRIYGLIPNTNPLLKRLYEFHDWRGVVAQIQQHANGQRLVGNNYQICAKVSFYNKKMIPCLHLNSRKSQFDYLKNIPAPKKDEKITFISYFNLPGSVKIELPYPQEIYIKNNITVDEIKSYINYEKNI